MHRLVLTLGLLVAGGARADTTVSSDKLFDASSIALKESASVQRFLGAVAEHLKGDKARVLRIEVHCDERSGAQDNTYLAAERARRLVKALKKSGVKKKQVVTDAVGHTGVDRSPQTRRVLFDFSDNAAVPWPSGG